MTIIITLLIVAFGYLILKKLNPFLFWNKSNLGIEKFAKWKQIFSGKIISRNKFKNKELRFPQCMMCFMAALNRHDLPKGTIVDPSYADYNVIAVKINNELIFICKVSSFTTLLM